jgi:hypothetical protein
MAANLIDRLSAEGLLEPDRGQAHDGRLRRYYRLSGEGRRALAVAGLVLAVAGCSNITPLGRDSAPVSLPPARDLGSPIMMQVMRGQPPMPTGECPTASVALFGIQPYVPRVAVGQPVAAPVPVDAQLIQASPATETPTRAATPATPPPGVACYRPVGSPVTITSAAVSSVATDRNHPGTAWYGFVVAFPAADVAALTALIRRANDSGDAVGMSVAGKLWQAPQPRRTFIALRAEQINLLSRTQAIQLYRLLIPAG